MVDEVVSLLPSRRKGWAWLVIVLGSALCVLVWFTDSPAAAAAGVGGGMTGAVCGLGALLNRRRGGWWVVTGLLLIAVGVAGFVLLRGVVNM